MNSPSAAARLAAAALLALSFAGCGPLRELIAPTAPAMTGEWAALLEELRAYERSIGFEPTANFTGAGKDQASFHYCGRVSQQLLPWSYEDPAIAWSTAASESECRAGAAADDDIYFRTLEAQGESETPVTSAMLAGKLDRFVYLVIHEDCHDQFALPYGVEEALCDFLTHQAMSAFAEQKYPAGSRERRSIRRYAETQGVLALATIEWYSRVETLYARRQRGEINAELLLRERASLFEAAEKPLGFGHGELNNISLASNMTYSRYYPQIGDAYAMHGRDLARTVAFFRRLDAAKPAAAAAVQKKLGIEDARSIESLRAYEDAVMATLRAALRNSSRGANSL